MGGCGDCGPRTCDIPITKNAKSMRYNFHQRESSRSRFPVDGIVAGRRGGCFLVQEPIPPHGRYNAYFCRFRGTEPGKDVESAAEWDPQGLLTSRKRKTPGMRGASRAFESRTGAPSGIRTLDLGIKSPLLWPAELTARSEEILYSLERREASTNFHSCASSRDAQIYTCSVRSVSAPSTTSVPLHRRPLPATQRSSVARMPGRNTRMSAMVHAAPSESV